MFPAGGGVAGVGWGIKGGRYVGEPSHLHVQTVLKFGSLDLLERSGPE